LLAGKTMENLEKNEFDGENMGQIYGKSMNIWHEPWQFYGFTLWESNSLRWKIYFFFFSGGKREFSSTPCLIPGGYMIIYGLLSSLLWEWVH